MPSSVTQHVAILRTALWESIKQEFRVTEVLLHHFSVTYSLKMRNLLIEHDLWNMQLQLFAVGKRIMLKFICTQNCLLHWLTAESKLIAYHLRAFILCNPAEGKLLNRISCLLTSRKYYNTFWEYWLVSLHFIFPLAYL